MNYIETIDGNLFGMDDYRKIAADSREWGTKSRKRMKGSVRMHLKEDTRSAFDRYLEEQLLDPEFKAAYEAQRAAIEEGLRDSAAGRIRNLGSFAEYVDEVE